MAPPETNCDIFNGVVGVDMQVALGLDAQIEFAVQGDVLQHMVEEADTAVDFGGAGAIKVETELNPGLFGITFNFGFSLRHSIHPRLEM